MRRSMRGALLALSLGVSSGAHAVPGRDTPDARTAAAVLAVDNAWGDAEAGGNVTFVGQLLLPGYRSIGTDGKTTDREAILKSTKRHAASPDYKAKVTAWRQQHPSHGEVALFGDTAILTWVSNAADSHGKVQSCDIFVYRDRHWRAIYSQHVGA
ncbi:MAG: nuclear transport factor 2 family protein [Sphingomonas sp.]